MYFASNDSQSNQEITVIVWHCHCFGLAPGAVILYLPSDYTNFVHVFNSHVPQSYTVTHMYTSHVNITAWLSSSHIRSRIHVRLLLAWLLVDLTLWLLFTVKQSVHRLYIIAYFPLFYSSRSLDHHPFIWKTRTSSCYLTKAITTLLYAQYPYVSYFIINHTVKFALFPWQPGFTYWTSWDSPASAPWCQRPTTSCCTPVYHWALST